MAIADARPTTIFSYRIDGQWESNISIPSCMVRQEPHMAIVPYLTARVVGN